MKIRKSSKFGRLRACFAGFLVFIALLSGVMNIFASNNNVYAEPQEETNTEQEVNNGDGCKKSLGALGWLVCPTTGKIAEATDWLYDKIEGVLQIDPIPPTDDSPIYQIWKYSRAVTNIVFIIFLLVVIYSQLTGYGISNYGIKKVLPKLIVVAILMNLSFLICTLAIDVSNIVGNGIRGIFTSVEEAVLNSTEIPVNAGASMSEVYSAMAGGTALAVGGAMIAFDLGAIWMLIPMVLGAIVSVVSGLITIALRQAVVALLVMISPLAIVAYMLPNTEKWFQKWKKLLFQMLIFYPMFSLLFGASNLAGFAILAAAKDAFGVILGIAVQMFPLFFSWKLMKMSDTFLGNINTRLNSMAAGPLAKSRTWASSQRDFSRLKHLENANRSFLPSTRLNGFLYNRRAAREEEASEMAASLKLRGQAYAANRNYKNGIPTKEGEKAYARQAKNMAYSKDILTHKDNMNMGLGRLEAVQARATTAQKARLEKLDIENVKAADALKIEKARGEKIEYENAKGFHKRMENAMNVHFDDLHGDNDEYKKHTMNNNEDRNVARARYATIQNIMENDTQGIHYAVATAAQGYDTQKKVVEAKMQKYFEFTPPTKDVEYRLGELTKGKDAINNVDSIIAGLRILNQRGDTDLVKEQMENLLDHKVQLGTHASQALASFLMFEVKDNDPWLRRFGKYINLETANVYNKNKRKVMEVTYDEYLKGYHDGEPDLMTDEDSRGRMYAKKDVRSLSEGTSLDNIERTALSNLDESLKKAYGYNKENGGSWDIKGWMDRRKEIQTAFEPAFLSASLKWLSGSEQINSGVKFWTGYEIGQLKDDNGNLITDEDGVPINGISPVWKGKEFAGHEKEVEKYFREKTNDYFKDQTTGQILAMRTDYRDPTMEHLLQSYLDDDTDGLDPAEKRRDYEQARAEIQTRYNDRPPKEAKDLRDKDLKSLKMELSGRYLRKILGKTGKLEQIYRTRRSGAANNAKDWLRSWIGLDDEEAMFDEVKFYERQRKQQQDAPNADSDSDDNYVVRIYDEETRSGIRDSLEKIWEDNRDVSGPQLYDIANEAIVDWFGEGETVVGKKFEEYYNRKMKSGVPDAYDLKKHLEDLLHDPNNYPDA